MGAPEPPYLLPPPATDRELEGPSLVDCVVAVWWPCGGCGVVLKVRTPLALAAPRRRTMSWKTVPIRPRRST